MVQTSNRWLLSAGLVALGAAFDAAAVTLHWRACDGGLRSDSWLVATDQAAMFPLPETW